MSAAFFNGILLETACAGKLPSRHRRAATPREADLKIWKFPDQVVRLAILFLVAGTVLLVVRQRFVPPSFGKLGHYRADAVAENSDRSPHYAGRETCIECHAEEGSTVAASFHRTLGCEVCHGPAVAHAEDPTAHRPVIPRERGAACLYCHEYLASRPTGFPQIVEPNHNPGQPCIDCHLPHDPTPPEVPGSCAACHREIASTISISHHANLGCATCHEATDAHREQPRRALPTKPTERRFCGRCHDVGARSSGEIPRIDLNSHGMPYLCWQCHYPHFPES